MVIYKKRREREREKENIQQLISGHLEPSDTVTQTQYTLA
jgi:hypothetical protein